MLKINIFIIFMCMLIIIVVTIMWSEMIFKALVSDGRLVTSAPDRSEGCRCIVGVNPGAEGEAKPVN